MFEERREWEVVRCIYLAGKVFRLPWDGAVEAGGGKFI